MTNTANIKKPRLIVSDVDKTLTSANTWFELTKALGGDVEEHFRLYNQYLKEQISHDEMSQGLVKMLTDSYGQPIHREVLYNIFFKIPINGEAFSTFRDLMEKGYQLCLISASIDMFVEIIGSRLQVDKCFANSQLIFDENGNWIDFKYDKYESELKLNQLNGLIDEEKISKDEVLIIGDSRNDVELFKHFNGVAVDSTSQDLNKLAWREIKYLPTLLQILEGLG